MNRQQASSLIIYLSLGLIFTIVIAGYAAMLSAPRPYPTDGFVANTPSGQQLECYQTAKGHFVCVEMN